MSKYVITAFIIYLLQNMFFLHMRYRQELRSRIAAQYLESRIRSKIDKTHITPLGEKAISPNDWLIKLYSEHSAPIVLSS